jgi:lipopolysaccharide/colanic/teichoic acid biosynthesis glycosyltransferase
MNNRIRWLILASDLVCVVLALSGSFVLRYHKSLRYGLTQPVQGSIFFLLAVSLAIWFLLYIGMDLDCFHGGWQMSAMISKTWMAVMLHMGAIVAWGYWTQTFYSRLVLLWFGMLLWVGVFFVRLGVHHILWLQRQAGKTKKVVLIGDNSLSREIVYRIRRHPELLYEIVGFLSPSGGGDAPLEGHSAPGFIGISSLDTLEFLRKRGVGEVIVATEHAPGIELQNLLVRCQEQGIHIHLVPQPYELYLSRPRLIEIDGVPLISLEQPSLSQISVVTKRIVDLSLSALLFVPAMVILALAGGALWVREHRFLRRETRCGQYGKPFEMYRLDIENYSDDAPDFHKLVAKLSISELPQIFNVFRGEMSLVGPRPERQERVRDYSEWQRQRLKVVPGMTGLAQVNGFREQHPSEEKIRYDLEYILYWTPVLDLVVLVRTIWTLAGRLIVHRRKADGFLLRRTLRKRRKASETATQAIGE